MVLVIIIGMLDLLVDKMVLVMDMMMLKTMMGDGSKT